MLFGIFFSHYILQEFQHQLHHSLRLQTPEEDQKLYNQWQSDYDPGASPEYWTYYFFNVTNLDEVIYHGAVPEVVECGPYVYREFETKFNVTFADGSNLISYNEQTDYAYETNLSCLTCKEDDMIFGLWPTYVTLIKEANSTSNAEGLLAPPLTNLTLTALERAASAAKVCEDDASCRSLVIGQWTNAEGIENLIPANTSMSSSQAFLDLLPKLVGLEIFGDVLQATLPRGLMPEFSFSAMKSQSTLSAQDFYDLTYNASMTGYSYGMASNESPDSDPSVGCAAFFLETFESQSTGKYFPKKIADNALPVALHFLSVGKKALPSLCELAGSVHAVAFPDRRPLLALPNRWDEGRGPW